MLDRSFLMGDCMQVNFKYINSFQGAISEYYSDTTDEPQRQPAIDKVSGLIIIVPI